MTQHNITGSEAFNPNAHVLIRVAKRVRRPWHPAVKAFAVAGVVGAVASLIDAAIGAPVCLVLVSVIFFALWIWPSY